MPPELASVLDRLSASLRTDARDLAILFWLRAYAALAVELGSPRVRWPRLSRYIVQHAAEFGLDGLDRAPGRRLIASYGLFQAVDLDAGSIIVGETDLLAVDLRRGFAVELLPAFQTHLSALLAWTEAEWDSLLQSSSGSPAALSGILARWAPEGRSGLLPALIEVQALAGWVSPANLAAVARALNVPLSEAYGVATYYKLLYTRPAGRRIIRVCDDVRCFLAGSQFLLHTLASTLSIQEGETTRDGEYTLELAPCLGHCDCAPVVQVNDQVHEGVTASDLTFLERAETPPQGLASGFSLLKDIEDPALCTLAGYLARGGLRALRHAVEQSTPGAIIAEVKASGLVGRGGAAFPTGLKWELTANAIARTRAAGEPPSGTLPRERAFGYVVCNADESETGTFKDRILLERNPFLVLEGILLAAYAVGAAYGYIYIRGEYPLAYARFRAALQEARAAGYLGPAILGGSFSFELEIRRGAGAYECGEETALFESIEGKRGEPRVKPPFPVEQGLFHKPTVINNVETLANVPAIIREGAASFRSLGTPKSPGTRLVCLSGSVRRPGVYEIAMGTSLRTLIEDLGGGLSVGRSLRAVLIGGAAGVFLTPEQIDVPLAFESLAAVGATLGSGAVIVLDDTADLWGVLSRIARFFRDESCGKCFPCQLGTQRQLEIVSRFGAGATRPGDRDLLFELGQTMRDASLCGLGQFAPTAILSTFEKGLVQ